VQARLDGAEKEPENGPDSTGCAAGPARTRKVREAVVEDDGALKLEPSCTRRGAIRRGDRRFEYAAGDNSQFIRHHGLPRDQRPDGYSRGGTLPAGMTIYGRP